MSKIGQRKLNIPDQVTFSQTEEEIKVTGPKGELNLVTSRNVKVTVEDKTISVARIGNDKKARAMHGLYWKLVSNMLVGVSEGFVKKLDFKGVGFKAEVNNNNLTLNVGFSHPVQFPFPDGVTIEVQKNVITVSGIDRQKVGQAAAEIRHIKPVEPYKGKGIKYIDEIPRRKPGKAAKTALGAK